jgi:hypothetical protein
MAETAKITKPTQAGRARFEAVLEELRNELDIVETSMFAVPAVKVVDGEAFAGLYGDDMIFRLEGGAHAKALALDGAHHFEPVAGRPMPAWVQVPPTHETQWAELAREAAASVGD